jgi:amidohydrolase
MDLETSKTDIQAFVDQKATELVDLSQKIHQAPELGYEEQQSAAWLTDFLEKNGFEVERGVAGMPTAFKAVYGRGAPVIAFMAEYDALPGIGHGCGHNIIGAAAAGAGLALKKTAAQAGAAVVVMGCPAEELLGGKVALVDHGAFEGVDAALQIHPAARDENWAGFTSTACVILDVEYYGREAHAAAGPWEGNSALQALINAFNNVNGLRLHLRDGSRISGIITHGGEAVNIIPARAAGKFQMRSLEDNDLDELKAKVLNCIESAALPTSCRVEHQWGPRCNAMKNNETMLSAWRKNMAALGREVTGISRNSGSTDAGNVSVRLPTIHAFLSISRDTRPFHSKEFSEAAGSPYGQKAVIDGAKAMAMTAADMILDPEFLQQARREFESD